MARRKQLQPMERIPSGEVMQSPSEKFGTRALYVNGNMNGHARKASSKLPTSKGTKESGSTALFLIYAAGIYFCFIGWGFLQERLTKTPYPTTPSSLEIGPAQEYWRFSVFLNTIQAACAALAGGAYLLWLSYKEPRMELALFPNDRIMWPLVAVSITATLASPFGYASLAHVDYLTFVLAKSCKLLPVMALHILIFRKRYAWEKFVVVATVTAGVAIFTLSNAPSSNSKSKSKKGAEKSSLYGLALLSINLAFDGLTNVFQDHIFKSPHRYGSYKPSSRMMVAMNLLSFALMSAYLMLGPLIPVAFLPPFVSVGNLNEFSDAIAFLQRHPSVVYDVLGFCICGALGQIFIYLLLERFESLYLVGVTVTRKMFTMMISVLYFGKSLTQGQWLGLALAFGGIALEAGLSAREQKLKKK